jgi:hypothetical protein
MNPRTKFGAAHAPAASLDRVREMPRCTYATVTVSEGTENATGLDLMTKGRSLGPLFLNGLCYDVVSAMTRPSVTTGPER